MTRRLLRGLHGQHAGRLAIVTSIVAVFLAAIIGVSLLTGNTTTPAPHFAQSKPQPTKKASTVTHATAISTHTSQTAPMIPVKVSAYTIEGRMADGKWTHLGACAVSTTQFPLGTVLNLYKSDGSFELQCLAEDTGSSIGYGQIDLAMPGNTDAASRWGIQNLWVRVVRWGWG